ncbi:MAG: serine/threonine-protein kinase [Bythopirellula sp.]|nr:serine/threonine-protein kinase [Bythopirellula sp.]
MNAKPLESEPEERPKGADPKGGGRFTYPSGSQPLAGYTIKRGVGRGGFGEVYYAVSDAGKEVALKLIRRNLDVEVRGVTHCLNLKHPNLVALYDIKTDDNDDRWVVMEYVSGESLEDAVDRHPQGMPVDLALEWFSGIAAGVAYLHDHGIVHRDLKPANIFLDEGTVKIGDYGLSKFISCSRRSGQTESVGTVHYMAPEIANGRYGREIDTYALGIILYEMLTGHVPFEGESVGEVLMKHLTAEPDLNAVSEPYRSIVQGAMTKDPETRIRSVAEMLASLGVANPPSVMGNVGQNYNGHTETTGPYVESAANGPTWPPYAPHEGAESVEEPIGAFVHQSWQTVQKLFTEMPLPRLVKGIIIGVICFNLVRTFSLWFPYVIPLAITYGVYRVIWTIIVQPASSKPSKLHRGPTYPPTPSTANTPVMPVAALSPTENLSKKEAKRRRKQSMQRQLREHLAAKPLHDRLAELVGSMFIAVLVSSVAALVICLIAADPFSKELLAWLAAVGSLGCWAIMIPAKLVEGNVEDQAPLRFMQLLLGAVVGVLAWASADWLMLPLMQWNSWGTWPNESLMSNTVGLNAFGPKENAGEVVKTLPLQMFAAYFAFLFVLVAWWEQTEATRGIRVNIWTIAWCGLVAWLLHFIWWFPQPLGLLIAAIMAFTLQFASPWLSPSRRRAITEREVV